MRRVLIALIGILATGYSLLPTASFAACCRCYKGTDTAPTSFCVNDASVTACSGAAAQIAGLSGLESSLTADIACASASLPDSACALISGGNASAQCRVITHLTASEIRGALPSSSTPAPAAMEEETPAAPPFQPIEVHLGVSIGSLKTIGGAQSIGGNISIPYLAQYVNAIYRYLVGIVIVVAIVMVVYGGFLYMIGSTTNSVGRGKEIIRDALVGLVLTLGAYLILTWINPSTTSLRDIILPSVQRDEFEMAENGTDFGDASDSNFTAAPSGGNPYPDTPLGGLELCAQLRPYIDDGTIQIPQPQDREGILGGTGFIRRPNGSEWCQLADTTRADPASCSGLKTQHDLDVASGGRPVTFDDGTAGVPIHPMLCRYLLDLARAKHDGLVRGTIIAKVVGRHHRCANGAWFFRSETSNNNCSTLEHGREECIQCVERIVAGNISNSGQSNHWSGQAFDLTNNESIQRYTVNTLAPRYQEENGGNPVFNDVFGGNIEPHTGEVNCSTRAGRIQTGAWCVDGRCATDGRMVSVGMDAICGHYSGGSNSHIHVSFY